MSAKPELTIVIPAKNEEASIVRLLRSLTYQNFPIHSTPIYLADANSTDKTVELANLFASRANLLGFNVIPGGLPAKGRNAGAARATTPYVLFLDADVELIDSDLLNRALARIKEGRLHCVTTDIFTDEGLAPQACYYLTNICQRGSRFVGTPFATGMFMLFDRGEFNRLGGFREDALYAEDYMLSKQVGWDKFGVVRGGVNTSARRMRKMGYWKLAKLFFGTALFGHRESQFTKDHGYWHV